MLATIIAPGIFFLVAVGVWLSDIQQKNNIALLIGSIGVGILIAKSWIYWRKNRRLTNTLQQLAQGQPINLSEKDQTQPWMNHMRVIQKKMNEVIEFIKDLGRYSDTNELQHIDPKEALGQALLGMQSTLQSHKADEEKRNWSAEGLAYFSGLLKNHTEDIDAFSDQVIRQLVKYLGVNQGALFIRGEANEEAFLELAACYAYDKKRHTQKRLALGQSLVGQCAIERKTIQLTQVPDQYTNITSGLGEATPLSIIIVPLLFNEKVYGVIEIASFTVLEAYQIEFIEKLAESIASSLSIVQTSDRMRELLRNSQQQAEELEKLSLVANNTNNSVIIADKNRRIEFVNQGFTNMTGYTADEVIGKTPGSILQGPGTDRETVKRIRYQLHNGLPLYEEILNYRKDGKKVWISLTINPIKDEAENIVKYISIQADITSIKNKSLEYTHKLEAISRSNAIVEFDPQGVISNVNDLYLSITGYEREDLLGKNYSYLLPKTEINQPQTQMMWDNLKEGTFFSGEFKQRSREGKELWLNGTFNPTFDLENKIQTIMMFAQFTTHEKKRQNDLSGMLKAFTSNIMTFEIAPEGSVKKANALFLQRTGYKRREIAKLQLADLMQGANQLPELVRAVQQQESFIQTLTLLSKSGKAISCQCSFTSILDLEGQLSKIMVVVLELEEQMVSK
ncbi:MAG: PAS domain S-box protein [Bacteroidota bacterium]